MKDSKLKRVLVAAYEVFYEARRMAVLRTKYRLRIMSPERTLRYSKDSNSTFPEMYHYYEIGFPKLMKLYWFGVVVLRKLGVLR